MVAFSSSGDVCQARQTEQVSGHTDARPPGGLGVNAAFLQEVKDDNRQFFELKRDVCTALDSQSQVDIDMAAIADLLAQLCDQLAKHFSLEERLGYLDDAVNVAPRLSRRAETLLRDHESLYQQLCSIAGDAEQYVSRRHSRRRAALLIRKKFEQFHRDFERHEKREDDLIIESLYFDIGGLG